MNRFSILVAGAVALGGCSSRGLPPGTFGVNLVVDLAAGLRSSAASAQLSVSGDETYGRSIALSAFDGSEARVQYIPGVQSGTLVFGVTVSSASGQVIGGGSSDPVTLLPGRAVTATVNVIAGVGGSPDLAMGGTDDLGSGDMAAAIDIAVPPDLSTPPPDLTIPPPKRVFVTSTTYTGNLGGLTGADAKCQARAQAAALTGTYKAWLSDGTQSPSMSTRFTQSIGSYVLVNGSTIANNWTQLTGGTLLHAININELGGGPPSTNAACMTSGGTNVWTDTSSDGTLFSLGDTCGGWTDPTGTASEWGNATSQTNWTYACNGGNSAAIGCGSVNALYCFEQ